MLKLVLEVFQRWK